MLHILCVGYRQWALAIYDKISQRDDILVTRCNGLIAFKKLNLEKLQPDFILFYGWSELVNKNIIDKFKCIMLHPSPLPKYRGGSPIQNQIKNGETKSAVTLFVMDHGIDSGDIIFQKEISLDGDLQCILNRIIEVGTEGTNLLLNDKLDSKPQDENGSTYFTRLKPSESEIFDTDFNKFTAKELYNKQF